MRILLVEDERALSKVLKEILEAENYIVEAVYDGKDGLYYAQNEDYDLIILDIMLPLIDGITVLKKIRKKGISTPIIMLTAKSQVSDKVAGLDYGADDYITKPFATEELLARVRSASRRKEVIVVDNKTFGDLVLNKNTLTIKSNNKSITLSLKEFLLLELLIDNKNIAVPKETLINKIWGYDFEGEYNIIEVYVSFIRKKLKSIASNEKITAVRGIGYIMESSND